MLHRKCDHVMFTERAHLTMFPITPTKDSDVLGGSATRHAMFRCQTTHLCTIYSQYAIIKVICYRELPPLIDIMSTNIKHNDNIKQACVKNTVKSKNCQSVFLSHPASNLNKHIKLPNWYRTHRTMSKVALS